MNNMEKFIRERNGVEYVHLTYSETREVLRNAGFIWLTAESDALSLRILFDVTPEACESLKSFLQVNEIQFASNWNSSDGQTGSVLLSRGVIQDLFLYLLLKDNAVVIKSEVNVSGFEKGSHFFLLNSLEDWATLKEDSLFKAVYDEENFCFDKQKSGLFANCRILVNEGKERNQHFFSGRIS